MPEPIKGKTIKRAPHGKDNPYFAMLRETAQANLSYEAVGMMAYLLSKPDNWEINVKDLQRDGCGRNKVYRVIHELCAAGYMKMASKYQDKKTKRWVWNPYEISETPQFRAEPYPQKPYTENGDIEHNTDQQNQLDTNVSNTAAEKAPVPAQNSKPQNDQPSENDNPVEQSPLDGEKDAPPETPLPPHAQYFGAIQEAIKPPPWNMIIPSRTFIGRVAKWLYSQDTPFMPEDVAGIIAHIVKIAKDAGWGKWHLTCIETFAEDWRAKGEAAYFTAADRASLIANGQDPDDPVVLATAKATNWHAPIVEVNG